MKLGYVVLYVESTDKSVEFWTAQIGMSVQSVIEFGAYSVVSLSQSPVDVALQLVPLELMNDNPDNLDLATPSICFYVDNLDAERKRLIANGVEVSDIMQHGDVATFGFSDNESHWFAVMQNIETMK
jgi:catechol 2,3-dioxygenase-like lactoylglutathione lyase family enzyme